jgi:Raf kinase inhibitor-like YbhB/YbcL family protein
MIKSLLSVLTLVLLAAASPTGSGFQITSSAFVEGKEIPKRFTCDGENVSPVLAWPFAPKGTKAFALIVDDPDAPGGLFTHWIVFNLPGASTGIGAAVKPDTSMGKAKQGTNDFGKVGYGGPCPPKGRHRYVFHLYALRDELSGLTSPNRKQIDAALKGHVIAEATLMGTYQR